jgi:hypothetical protein
MIVYKKPVVTAMLDSFIPVAIRNDRNISQQALVRTRAMVAVLAISVIVPLLMLLAYVALQFFTDKDFSKNIIIMLAVEVVLVSQHLYFQSYGNLRITAGVYSLQFLFVVIATVVVSAGLKSPVLILLICSPMVAFMTMSIHAALFHIAAVLFTVIGLLVMYVNGFGFMSVGQQSHYPYTLVVCWVVALVFFSLFLVVFDELIRSKN